MGQAKDSLITEGKRERRKKMWCKCSHSSPPTSRPMPSLPV